MRIIQVLGVIAALGCLPFQALAFDECDDFFTTQEEIREFLFARGVYDAPVKYFDHARSIRIETGDGSGGLLPHATFDAEGRPIIVYPTAFLPTLCRIALATYLEIDGEWLPFAEASRDAGQCVDSGRPFGICLVEYGRDLERRYRGSFEALDGTERRKAYSIYVDAAAQIGIHEYAHHLLKHPERIESGGIVPIDAEFESDFYAILNGSQIGEAPSAMFYFFKALADVESYSETLRSPTHESSACRATNIDDITGLFGITPMLVLDAVDGGGGFRDNSPAVLTSAADELRREGSPSLSADSCGRLSGTVLRETHGELAHLTALVAEYGHILFIEPTLTEQTLSGASLALGAPEAVELIDRLQSETESFVHVKGLAVQVISKLIQRVGYAGTEATVARQLDRVLETSANDVLSRDYGRLLKVRGLITLYQERDRPLEARMTEARRIFQESVTFSPGGAESWANLAMIAFAEGRCGDAADLIDKMAHVASNDRARGAAEEFGDRVRGYSAAGRCAEEAERFAASFAR